MLEGLRDARVVRAELRLADLERLPQRFLRVLESVALRVKSTQPQVRGRDLQTVLAVLAGVHLRSGSAAAAKCFLRVSEHACIVLCNKFHKSKKKKYNTLRGTEGRDTCANKGIPMRTRTHNHKGKLSFAQEGGYLQALLEELLGLFVLALREEDAREAVLRLRHVEHLRRVPVLHLGLLVHLLRPVEFGHLFQEVRDLRARVRRSGKCRGTDAGTRRVRRP